MLAHRNHEENNTTHARGTEIGLLQAHVGPGILFLIFGLEFTGGFLHVFIGLGQSPCKTRHTIVLKPKNMAFQVGFPCLYKTYRSKILI
jgi:hypothetical protein